MHPHAKLLSVDSLRHSLAFLTPLIDIQPCVQSMYPNFAARRNDPLQLRKDLINIVAAGAAGRTESIAGATGVTFSRDHEKRRSKALFHFKVAGVFAPGILGNPEVHQWEQANCTPVLP